MIAKLIQFLLITSFLTITASEKKGPKKSDPRATHSIAHPSTSYGTAVSRSASQGRGGHDVHQPPVAVGVSPSLPADSSSTTTVSATTTTTLTVGRSSSRGRRESDQAQMGVGVSASLPTTGAGRSKTPQRFPQVAPPRLETPSPTRARPRSVTIDIPEDKGTKQEADDGQLSNRSKQTAKEFLGTICMSASAHDAGERLGKLLLEDSDDTDSSLGTYSPQTRAMLTGSMGALPSITIVESRKDRTKRNSLPIALPAVAETPKTQVSSGEQSLSSSNKRGIVINMNLAKARLEGLASQSMHSPSREITLTARGRNLLTKGLEISRRINATRDTSDSLTQATMREEMFVGALYLIAASNCNEFRALRPEVRANELMTHFKALDKLESLAANNGPEAVDKKGSILRRLSERLLRHPHKTQVNESKDYSYENVLPAEKIDLQENYLIYLRQLLATITKPEASEDIRKDALKKLKTSAYLITHLIRKNIAANDRFDYQPFETICRQCIEVIVQRDRLTPRLLNEMKVGVEQLENWMLSRPAFEVTEDRTRLKEILAEQEQLLDKEQERLLNPGQGKS